MVAQRPSNFPVNDLSVGPSVGRSIGLSVCLSSALWKNGGSDPDAIWHHRSDGSRDKAGSGVWVSVHGHAGTFGANLGRAIVQRGLYGARVLQRRDAAVFTNYFGQTCYVFLLYRYGEYR